MASGKQLSELEYAQTLNDTDFLLVSQLVGQTHQSKKVTFSNLKTKTQEGTAAKINDILNMLDNCVTKQELLNLENIVDTKLNTETAYNDFVLSSEIQYPNARLDSKFGQIDNEINALKNTTYTKTEFDQIITNLSDVYVLSTDVYSKEETDTKIDNVIDMIPSELNARHKLVVEVVNNYVANNELTVGNNKILVFKPGRSQNSMTFILPDPIENDIREFYVVVDATDTAGNFEIKFSSNSTVRAKDTSLLAPVKKNTTAVIHFIDIGNIENNVLFAERTDTTIINLDETYVEQADVELDGVPTQLDSVLFIASNNQSETNN